MTRNNQITQSIQLPAENVAVGVHAVWLKIAVENHDGKYKIKAKQ
jgi:hypothetical protein